MINHIMNNAVFSNVAQQTNRNNAQVNAKNESLDGKKTQESPKASSKLDSIKESIQNGTYKINIKGSAEKLAQELLK